MERTTFRRRQLDGYQFSHHWALELGPWRPNPLPQSVNPLGVDSDNPPESDGTACAASWSLAVEVQRALIQTGAKMLAGVAS